MIELNVSCTWAKPPLMGMNAVEERAYAEPTQMKLWPPRSWVIVGNAVATADCAGRSQPNDK